MHGDALFFLTFEDLAHFPFEMKAVVENEIGGIQSIDISLGCGVAMGVDSFSDDVEDLCVFSCDFAGNIGDHAHGGGDLKGIGEFALFAVLLLHTTGEEGTREKGKDKMASLHEEHIAEGL